MLTPEQQARQQIDALAAVGRRLSVIDELATRVATNLAHAHRLQQSILQKAFAVNEKSDRDMQRRRAVNLMLYNQ